MDQRCVATSEVYVYKLPQPHRFTFGVGDKEGSPQHLCPQSFLAVHTYLPCVNASWVRLPPRCIYFPSIDSSEMCSPVVDDYDLWCLCVHFPPHGPVDIKLQTYSSDEDARPDS